MKQDFIIIPAATLAVGLMAWSCVDHRHTTWPVKPTQRASWPMIRR